MKFVTKSVHNISIETLPLTVDKIYLNFHKTFHSQIFVEFENIFGPYLKSLVSDPDEIDQMLKKIYKLVTYIVKIDYDIFNPGNLENWENTLELFYEKLAKIEKESMALLAECINNLRYVERK